MSDAKFKSWTEFREEFEKSHQDNHAKQSKLSRDGSLLGGMLGMMSGGIAAPLALQILGSGAADPLTAFGVFAAGVAGGSAVGVLIGGSVYRSSSDQREEAVDAYARYVEDLKEKCRLLP